MHQLGRKTGVLQGVRHVGGWVCVCAQHTTASAPTASWSRRAACAAASCMIECWLIPASSWHGSCASATFAQLRVWQLLLESNHNVRNGWISCIWAKLFYTPFNWISWIQKKHKPKT
eukprot:9495574-Pyramimonas_sp.AAC.1